MRRLFKRIKGKNLRDYIVFGKRKLFLKNVISKHSKYGEEYYFSSAYIGKHIKGGVSDQLIHSFLDSSVGLFGNISALKERLVGLSRRSPPLTQEIVDYANLAVAHRFDLLGSGLVGLDFPVKAKGIWGTVYDFSPFREPHRSPLTSEEYREIDWHCDFKSGYRWNPESYYPESRKYVEYPGADIKVVWELSRCQHLPMVGLAYLLTSEKVYAEEVYSQIIDWIDNNPLCKGPNWNCPMDVGIRVANWLVALELIRQYRNKDYLSRARKIISSLVQHLDYLWNNFEWTSKLTSNHYLSDIAGFLFCVTYIPNLVRDGKYRKFVKTEFESEIIKQMYYDGMNSEGSLPYHRLVLELFSYSALLAHRNGLEFDHSFYEQLERSFDFTSIVMKPDFTMPQIGDNDGGIFLRFFPRELPNFGYLNALGVSVFNYSFGETDSSCQLEYELFNCTAIRPTSNNKIIKSFAESGISIYKDNSLYFSLYHGLNGQKGNGGHCHNDRNSLTLQWKGLDILEDAGTGIYTAFPQIRNKFRSTSNHNTVSIYNEEQNRFYDNETIFKANNDITFSRVDIDNNDERLEVCGYHNGFSRIDSQLLHIRKVTYDFKKAIEICDDLGGERYLKQASFLIPNMQDLVLGKDYLSTNLFEFKFEEFESITYGHFGYSPEYGIIHNDYFVKVNVLFRKHLKTYILLK